MEAYLREKKEAILEDRRQAETFAYRTADHKELDDDQKSAL